MERIKFVSGNKDLFNNYTITNFIAKGNNTVYQTVHRSNKQDIQCVKEIRLVDRNSEAIYQKEVKLLESLSQEPHESIIEFKGSYVISQELSEFNCCKKGFIQMEKGITSLDHLIADRVQTGIRFTENEIIHFLTTMIEAHKHLQSKAIAHRDIKPENIILVGMDPLYYKVCDVGVGTAVGSDSTRTRTLMGTVSYLSPELLKAYRENKYNVAYNPHRSDVYSMGLVALFFCSLGKLLAKDRGEDQQQKVLVLIKQIKRSYKGIHGLSKTLKLMLKYNEAQRPDFYQLHNTIEENGWLQLKYDALRTASLHKFMSHSVPTEGATQIKSPEEAPLLQMYTENPKILHTLRIDLPGMNKNNLQLKEVMIDLRRIKDLDLNKLSVNLELNTIQGETIKGICDGIEKNVHLTELELFLWNNQLKEKGLCLVLDVFKKLPQLKKLYLNLSANNLSDFKGFAQKIKSLENLVGLEELALDLGLNRFTSESIPDLFSTLSKLGSLRKLKLNLESNRITPLALKSLPQCLSSLKSLREITINLSGNRVGNEGMYALGDLIQVIPNLTSYELILWNAELTDKGIIEFMRSASKNCKHIKEFKLVLWNNSITEKALETLQVKLPEFQNLEKIYFNFSNNKIGDGGVRLLNKSMIKLPRLREVKLGLDCTGTTEVGCRYIGRMLSEQKNLLKLDLSLRANSIGKNGLDFITAGLKECKKLTQFWLVLEGCKVGDDGITFLSKILPRLRQLHSVYFNLSDCNLFDDGMFILLHSLQTTISDVKEISVDLRRNMLSPVMRSRIQYEIGGDKRVQLKLDEAQ